MVVEVNVENAEKLENHETHPADEISAKTCDYCDEEVFVFASHSFRAFFYLFNYFLSTPINCKLLPERRDIRFLVCLTSLRILMYEKPEISSGIRKPTRRKIIS